MNEIVRALRHCAESDRIRASTGCDHADRVDALADHMEKATDETIDRIEIARSENTVVCETPDTMAGVIARLRASEVTGPTTADDLLVDDEYLRAFDAAIHRVESQTEAKKHKIPTTASDRRRSDLERYRQEEGEARP